ncbi:MAG: uracil-DNA glycosylase [Thermodesulfobacteriota bacterium]
MSTKEELAAIIAQAKKQIVYSKEISLEPPPLSEANLAYLAGTSHFDTALSFSTPASSYGSLEELEQFIGECDRCKLGPGRKHIVFGEGNPHARLVFVGEAPGMDEDITGKPFVGQAGKLLTDIIKAMGLTRDEVYICNIVKCHPPRNRDPEADEIEACLPFLKAQISLIKPEIICTLGRVSAQSVVGRDLKITRDRGKWRAFMDIPLMPTYHPAYLLRYPQAKRQVWEDVQQIMQKLGLKDPRNVGP